jgi:hypothetical protein
MARPSALDVAADLEVIERLGRIAAALRGTPGCGARGDATLLVTVTEEE